MPLLTLLVGFIEEDGKRGRGTLREPGVTPPQHPRLGLLAVAGPVEVPDLGQAVAAGGEVLEQQTDGIGRRRTSRGRRTDAGTD